MMKAFSNTAKQQAQIGNFIKRFRNNQSAKSKVTGLSDAFFKGVEKSFKNNPKLEQTSPGYYGFKKAKGAGKNLEEVAEQLEGAVKAHGKQAKAVRKHIAEMKNMKSPAKKYVSDEEFAKENKLGLWKGKFMEPEKWRKLN